MPDESRPRSWRRANSASSAAGAAIAAIHSHQRHPLFVHQPLAQLGHHDAGMGRGDAVGEDRSIGLAGNDVVGEPARAEPGGHRRLVDAEGRGVLLRGQQVEARVACRPVGAVAMGAVDLEPGPGAGVERAGPGVVPDGETRGVCRDQARLRARPAGSSASVGFPLPEA